MKSLQSSIYKTLYKTVDGVQVWTDLINEKLGVLVEGVHHDRVMLRSNLLEFTNGFHKCPAIVWRPWVGSKGRMVQNKSDTANKT